MSGFKNIFRKYLQRQNRPTISSWVGTRGYDTEAKQFFVVEAENPEKQTVTLQYSDREIKIPYYQQEPGDTLYWYNPKRFVTDLKGPKKTGIDLKA